MVSRALGARLARLRAQAYAVAALAFRQPDAALLRWFAGARAERVCLRMVRGLPASGPGTQMRRLVRAARAIGGPEGLRALVAEHNRLFSPTPTVRVPLWASAYAGNEQKVMGEPARRVAEVYARTGVGLSPDFRESPDHIVAELEFMSSLCDAQRRAWRSRQPAAAARWAALEREFVAAHLLPWIGGGLVPRLQEWAEAEFYLGAAEMLGELLAMDAGWTRTLAAALAGPLGS